MRQSFRLLGPLPDLLAQPPLADLPRLPQGLGCVEPDARSGREREVSRKVALSEVPARLHLVLLAAHPGQYRQLRRLSACERIEKG